VSEPGRSGEALARLDEITRRLRVECPWDREQDERSIVPHTVEEAYELADAANRGDDRKLLDELGDVLFQVVFLSLLLEERGEGDFAAVAEHCRQKLIRRHPHVFGDVEASTAGEVLRNWDEIKSGEEGREPGIFGEVPDNLPAPLYARKLLRRAASAGRELPEMVVEERVGAGDFDSIGDLMLAVVARARELKVDPELALRSAADRFRDSIDEEADAASE
jgi:MazG family protein